MYGARDAEQRVVDGRAAFLVRLDHDRTLLVRKRTGEYWDFPGRTDLHTARSDRRLRKALLNGPTGVVHDPALDVTMAQLMAWLDATYGSELMIGQFLDQGWAFLALKGPVVFGGPLGAMLAVVKRTGEVWDLYSGTQADAAAGARTEAGFRFQMAALSLRPIAQIPR
jgi:hypothetical protein